jgi:uncharacterized protein YggT (Ycf19 family)
MIGAPIIIGLTNFLSGVIELLIGLRIFLKFFGANQAAPFVSWIYETTDPLLSPFQGMFPSPEIASGFQLEISALFALLVYAFLAYLVIEFVHLTQSARVKRK